MADVVEQVRDTQIDSPVEEPPLTEEVLVEEVSIDGMCGVY